MQLSESDLEAWEAAEVNSDEMPWRIPQPPFPPMPIRRLGHPHLAM